MAILELQENGKIQMLFNKWWKNQGTCNRDDKKQDSKANALGVENVGGIFVVLIAGLGLAIIVSVLEFVWNSRKNAAVDKVRHLLFCIHLLSPHHILCIDKHLVHLMLIMITSPCYCVMLHIYVSVQEYVILYRLASLNMSSCYQWLLVMLLQISEHLKTTCKNN